MGEHKGGKPMDLNFAYIKQVCLTAQATAPIELAVTLKGGLCVRPQLLPESDGRGAGKAAGRGRV